MAPCAQRVKITPTERKERGTNRHEGRTYRENKQHMYTMPAVRNVDNQQCADYKDTDRCGLILLDLRNQRSRETVSESNDTNTW